MHQQPWAGLQGQVISLSQTPPGTCCLQLGLPVGNKTRSSLAPLVRGKAAGVPGSLPRSCSDRVPDEGADFAALFPRAGFSARQ